MTAAAPVPFEEAVVGVDGRDGGRDAVALAIALGAHRVTLAGVYGHEEDTEPTPVAGRYHRRLHDDMVRALEATRLQTGVVADLVSIGDRSPARALHHVAQDRRADVVVLGSAHHGPLGRLLLGDVSRGVLHGSPCAVAIAPHGYRTHPHRAGVVAVGYNGTPEADEALRTGAAIAAAAGAGLEVHVVWEGPTIVIAALSYSDDLDEIVAEERERAQRVLDQALATMPPGTKGELHHGSPGTELLRIAERADMLVLGSRGWGPARRIAVGSTADRVLHQAACPVVLVPRGAGVEDGGRPEEPAAIAAP